MKRSIYLTVVCASLLAWFGCKPSSQPTAVTPETVGQALPSGTTAAALTPSTTAQAK